jgi:lysophospholipase L1-like esterase
VTWGKSGDLSSLRGKSVRLRFELSRASLFSFRFARELPTRVVCLGDSVTKALGVVAPQRFASLVESRMRAEGREITVVNSGVGSDTTAGGLKRLETDVVAHDPQVACIMFGLNDSYVPKAGELPLVSLDDYSKNLRSIVSRLRERRIKPLLMTPNPFTTAEKDAAMKPYVEACRAVARETETPLIDVHARFLELAAEAKAAPEKASQLYTDDCHLSPAGNLVIADLLLPALEAALYKEP